MTAETDTQQGSSGKPDIAASAAPPNKEELLELVRAIKFANSEWSQRQVHTEIVETLAKEVPCLKDVKLNDVKKVWKKAVVAMREGGDHTPATKQKDSKTRKGGEDETKEEGKKEDEKGNKNEKSSTGSTNADLVKLLEGKTPQVFTVGDSSQVYPELAKYYTSNLLAKEIAKVDQEMVEEAKTYVHVYLDVPGNISGTTPHQALISFQDTPIKPYKNKGGENDLEIVKIQKAAPLSATDKTQHPMLVYNRSKTLRTFIHPAPMDVDDGQGDNDAVDGNQEKLNSYDKISKMIDQCGVGGALGGTGGTKAYFYARVTQLKKSPGILSIDYTRLAPTQDW